MTIHLPEGKTHPLAGLLDALRATYRPHSHRVHEAADAGHRAEYAHLLDADGERFHNIAPGAPITVNTVRRDIRIDYQSAAMRAANAGDNDAARGLNRQLAEYEAAWRIEDHTSA